MTKHLDSKSIDKLMGKLCVCEAKNRAASAPKLSQKDEKVGMENLEPESRQRWSDMPDQGRGWDFEYEKGLQR